MSRHSRPHACDEHGCKVKPFGNKHDLVRHRREVHHQDNEGKQPQKYYCPKSSCSRSRRGFARQWNMLEHRRKVHGMEKSGSSTPGPSATTLPPLSEVDISSPTSSSMSRVSSKLLSQELREKIIEAEQEKTTALRKIEEATEKLRVEVKSVTDRYDQKIKALEVAVEALEKS